MIRNVLGAVVALVGAVVAVISPFRAWYGEREGRDYRLVELFDAAGISDARADLLTSLFVLFVGCALVTLLGVLVRSRIVVAVAGVAVVGLTVLWMVRVRQALGSLALESDGSGLNEGVATAAAGGVIILLGALLMRGRGHGRRQAARRGREEGYEEGYGAGYDAAAVQQPYAAPGATAHQQYADPGATGQQPYAEPGYDAPAPHYGANPYGPPPADPPAQPHDDHPTTAQPRVDPLEDTLTGSSPAPRPDATRKVDWPGTTPDAPPPPPSTDPADADAPTTAIPHTDPDREDPR
ncbi:hypothetical protein [Streptomyces sp. NPDC060194]|uniref:hypothetical protein n=1 Tax=Streptomyces sp. NPDC060194 TaxID=3347069 RepID=UPI003651F6E9